MKARYWTSQGDDACCYLCPHLCRIAPTKRGLCKARLNKGGILHTLLYGHPSSIHIDPIEKKPLYHFLPGTSTFSFGTLGCNLSCLHCQNWDISTAAQQEDERIVSPEELIEAAITNSCPTISITYNEPLIAIEYVSDIARSAFERGIKTAIVSNGFINKKPLLDILPYTDAANIDLKSFSEEFYKDFCGAHLGPVLDTLKIIHHSKTHLEITNLIIPGKNDDMRDILLMCEWIVTELGSEVPLHFSAFHPAYKMKDIPTTPSSLVLQARKTALKAGLQHVYCGNIRTDEENSTYCSACGATLIKRSGRITSTEALHESTCICGKRLYGLFRVPKSI